MERDTVEPTAGHIILSGPDASEQQQNIDHRWSLWGRCWRRRKKNSDRRQSDWWNISAVSNKKMSSVATANFPLDASKSSAHRQTVVYCVIIVKIERGITAVSNRLTELPICQRVPAQKYFIRKYLKKKKLVRHWQRGKTKREAAANGGPLKKKIKFDERQNEILFCLSVSNIWRSLVSLRAHTLVSLLAESLNSQRRLFPTFNDSSSFPQTSN